MQKGSFASRRSSFLLRYLTGVRPKKRYLSSKSDHYCGVPELTSREDFSSDREQLPKDARLH